MKKNETQSSIEASQIAFANEHEKESFSPKINIKINKSITPTNEILKAHNSPKEIRTEQIMRLRIELPY